MAKNNLIVFGTEAEGSYCTTDSGRHVDVVTGTGAAIQIQHAVERGDVVVEIDHDEMTPDSTHATILTTPASNGYDTHCPAEHTVQQRK